MTDEERAIVKRKIESKLKRLNEDIVDLKEATKPIAPENSIGRVSRMDAINNKSVNEAALRSALKTKEKLENALNSIEDEDFGRCKRCKDLIPIKRLILMPESDRCVKCADRI